MSGWNYRVLRRVLRGHNYTEAEYAVYEVYYNNANEPTACSTDPVAPHGETPGALVDDLRRMLEAHDKPVLKYADIVNQETSHD